MIQRLRAQLVGSRDLFGAGPKRKGQVQVVCARDKTGGDAHPNVLFSQGPIGQAISPAKLKIAEYLHQWLDAMEGGVQPTTMQTYRFAIERYVILYLG
jgi:hypothetical protein